MNGEGIATPAAFVQRLNYDLMKGTIVVAGVVACKGVEFSVLIAEEAGSKVEKCVWVFKPSGGVAVAKDQLVSEVNS